MTEPQYKAGDRVVYKARTQSIGGTVIRVDSIPNPSGIWPGVTHYLFVILDTAEEVSDIQSAFWHERDYDPLIPF